MGKGQGSILGSDSRFNAIGVCDVGAQHAVPLRQLAMVAGIYNLPTDLWGKGFLGMGLLFVVGSSFSLAKTLRDEHEVKKLVNRLADVNS